MNFCINIIGAGKLGKTLGRLICQNRLAKIGAVINNNRESALEAIRFIGEGHYYSEMNLIPPAYITFITVPDDAIRLVSTELTCFDHLISGNIFIHCSGVLSSEALSALKGKGGFVASIHPMRSFADPATAIDQYRGTYCAMEGDEEALKVAKPLFEAIGSNVYSIDKAKKSLYHAAGVFGSNYLVTLAHQAMECLRKAGVQDGIALDMTLQLMRGTLNNIESIGCPRKALTGPVKRGDVLTLLNHMASLSDSKIKKLYAILGKATLDLTSHDVEAKLKLEESLCLDSECESVES